jgi:hypothetical protein
MVLRIVLFLSSYALWVFCGYRVHKTSIRGAGGHHFFRSVFFNSILFGLAIAVFPALHAGSINLKVACAFLLLSQSNLLVILIIRWFVDLQESTVMACSRWAGLFIGRTSKGFLVFGSLLTTIALIGYPLTVVATIIWPRGNPQMFAFKTGLLTFGLIAIPLLVWVFGSIVSHPFWKDSVRGQLFALLSSGFLNVFVFVILTMWAFGLTSSGKLVTLFGGTITVSPRLVGGLLFGMVLLYLLPHLRGVMWGGRTRKSYLNERASLLERLIAILKAPLPQTYVDRLSHFRDEVNTGLTAYTQSDPIYGLAAALEDPTFKPRKLRIEREAFLIARAYDIRFEHTDWVRTLMQSIGMVTADIGSKSADDARLTAAERWASFYQLEQANVRRAIDENSHSKTPLLIIFGFLLSPVASTLLSKCGEMVWNMLSKAMP